MYSSLGRGFLSSGPKMVENFTKEDYRQFMPRFQPENVEHNKGIFERASEIAAKKGCTPAQLALAWIHHQGDDVCPIPGTTKMENLNQNINALSVKLTPEEMAKLESLASGMVLREIGMGACDLGELRNSTFVLVESCIRTKTMVAVHFIFIRKSLL